MVVLFLFYRKIYKMNVFSRKKWIGKEILFKKEMGVTWHHRHLLYITVGLLGCWCCGGMDATCRRIFVQNPQRGACLSISHYQTLSTKKTFFFSSFLFFPINFYYPQLELNHLKNIPFPVSYFFFLFRNRGRGKSQFLFSFKFWSFRRTLSTR